MNEMDSRFEQRITRLERSLRRARLAASAAGLALAVLVAAGFARNLANPTPDGSAYVMLIDNLTRAVAKLHSDGKGGGGVQVFKWDMNAKQVHIKTLTYDGEQRDTMPMGK